MFNDIVNITHEECIDKIKKDWSLIKYVKDQTPELCLEAVKQNGEALEYVKDQTPEPCLEAVKQNGEALEYIKDQTPELCLEAVKQNAWALRCVKQQTPELCLMAVERIPYTLRYVKDQTPELCRLAIRRLPGIICNIREQTFELCLEAVLKRGDSLMYVRERRFEVCAEVIKRNPNIIEDIINYGEIVIVNLESISTVYAIDNIGELKNSWKLSNEEIIKLAQLAYDEDPNTYNLFKEEWKPHINRSITIEPKHFETLPSDINVSDLVDPITFEPLSGICGFIVDGERWHLAGSLESLNHMVINGFNGSNKRRVFIPIKNTVVEIKEIKWFHI